MNLSSKASLGNSTARSILNHGNIVEVKNDYCFGILALGKQYRFHAHQLLNDFEFFAPGVEVIVLTDSPKEFECHINASPSLFRPRGVLRFFSDKRFLAQAAFLKYSTCIIIDANIRILEPLPPDLSFQPGITPYLSYRLPDHFLESDSRQQMFLTKSRTQRLVYSAAESFGVAPENAVCPHEWMYAITNSGQATQRFFAFWDQLAMYMDYHCLAWSEGYCVGIAAAAAGIPVREQRILSKNSFYKYRFHRFQIQRGEPFSPRVVISHRDNLLLRQFARFSVLPKSLAFQWSRLQMGLRWLRFRFTGMRYRTIDPAQIQPQNRLTSSKESPP